MSSSSPFQSGLPSKQVNKKAFLEKLQKAKAKMNQEIASSTSTAAPIDSQTSTDYGTLPLGVPTTPTPTNYVSFPTDTPTTPTQEMNYRFFPGEAADLNMEDLDHKSTESVAQKDDTMTEAGDDTVQQD
ncbi:hypothetical protein BDD12DRAFT_901130 [Trichophaea hybrida]|nr:hypothetical protein BDD12DRAFT_901130 [Trichophaea hybrida]